MDSVGDGLRQFWLAQRMPQRRGATEEQLRRFESRHGVRLPPDLRDYFATVDGMDESWGSDEDNFCFWHLRRVRRASEWYLDRFLEDQAGCFVFADHLISFPAYAVYLSPLPRLKDLVLAIYSDNRKYESFIVADSFAEFVEGYLADDLSRINLSLGMTSRGTVRAPKLVPRSLADSAHPLWDREIDR